MGAPTQEAMVLPFPTGRVELLIRDVPLDQIKLDQHAQPRDHLNTEVVKEYAEAMALGAKFPPAIVFFDGSTHWLADGFHRHYAAVGNQLKTLSCDVRTGTLRDAILFSCGANATHGYKRSNADKRHAVVRMLQDPEWMQWSDREIARQCNVGAPLVGQIRTELAPVLTVRNYSEKDETSETDSAPADKRTYTTKHGTTSTMDTSRIGRSQSRDRGHSEAAVREPEPTREPTLTESLLNNPAYRKDQANSFIWSSLNSVEEELKRLGLSPEDAARRYPVTLKHAFSREKAEHLADWFMRFAKAWRF